MTKSSTKTDDEKYKEWIELWGKGDFSKAWDQIKNDKYGNEIWKLQAHAYLCTRGNKISQKEKDFLDRTACVDYEQSDLGPGPQNFYDKINEIQMARAEKSKQTHQDNDVKDDDSESDSRPSMKR